MPVNFTCLFHCFLTALLLLLSPYKAFAAVHAINIQAPPILLQATVSRLAIDDTVSLLKKAFHNRNITINKPGGTVRLLLPDMGKINKPDESCRSHSKYSCTSVPEGSYSWRSSQSDGVVTLMLQAGSPEGVANGLYGLLQEKIGFRFHHPRETIIPNLSRWPLENKFTFNGTPRFEKRGFHLHTLHPIELTEQLHNPAMPGALEDIKGYLNWLARNGQNTFQFFLLRGIDRKTWPQHASRIVDYAHQRGIRCGVEISLAMLQQQAFQAITLLRPYPSYNRQVDNTLTWLFQTPWDFISLEATLGEHLPFLDRLLPDVQTHLENEVRQRYGSKLLYATHVICAEKGDKVRKPRLQSSGIMIHTVMCYSASESKAPVYGNQNQRFMLEAATAESKQRETWYWPESSYWVGFDSSVPLLILPYLDARRDDIEKMSRAGVSGHLTFTSGWEWGYWLVDWSIARWSWQLSDNNRLRPVSPLSRLQELIPDPQLQKLVKAALEMQNLYLKEKELLRYMAALTPFSELPQPFYRPFQPDPGFSYSWLLHEAGQDKADSILAGPVTDLETYAVKMESLCGQLRSRHHVLNKRRAGQGMEVKLVEEMITGLQVTALRARHRALTLRALLAKRGHGLFDFKMMEDSERLLVSARNVRVEALKLVHQQERLYRYPVEQIARKKRSMTAYTFGYLYPASNLVFWEREEEQIREERFDVLFMNIWDMRRTLGLESLFLK